MDVTSIEKWKNNRYKVCLSNGADFVLYYKELSTYQIAEGEDLSEETYARILEEILVPRATKRAMHLLEKMDRSEKQLRGKLAENGYPQEAVDAAISYVASYHYLDDERAIHEMLPDRSQSMAGFRITLTILLAVDLLWNLFGTYE